MSEFRYHPLIEGLKVNADGTIITLNDEPLKIYIQSHGVTKKGRKVVALNGRTLTTTRLTLEAWQGVKPNGEMAARRIKEDGGDHYSNLCWGKKGSTDSNQKDNVWREANRKMNKEVFDEIANRLPGVTIKSICAKHGVSASQYSLSKWYGKKDK